jgi:hypothetical protein
MSDVGDAYDEVRAELAAEASGFLPDLCDLIDSSLTTQGSGHTLTDSALALNIPCSHKQLGGGGVQVRDGDTFVTKSHELELPYTSATILIDRHYQIRVHARGTNAEMIFEQPVRQFDSGSPLLEVLATATEGYRQPGMV